MFVFSKVLVIFVYWKVSDNLPPQTWEANRFKDWDDSRLKNLLEEAYSYKNPRDKENKSEIFLELLQKAESEKEDQSFKFHPISSRYDTTSSYHTQGGSLQNILGNVKYETIIDCDFNLRESRNRRNNHNSRLKKFTSVSSRKREGGSLPSKVNVSIFNTMNAVTVINCPKNNKVSNEFSATDTLCIGGKENGSSADKIYDQNCTKNNQTGQQETQFTQLNECHEQELKQNAFKFKPSLADFFPSSSQCYVDELVHFSTLELGKSRDINYSALEESYKTCKSVLGEKLDLVPTQSTVYSATKMTPKQLDENGNTSCISINSIQAQTKLKKKKPNSERNTKTLDLESVAGYRGQDPIEVLVKYIESSKEKKQNDKVSKIVDSKKKEKKKDKEKHDKEKNKMNKSSSLEELRSCSKLYSQENVDHNDSNLNKFNKNRKSENKIFEVEKEKLMCCNNHKAERRSWGTEELSFLRGNKINEECQDKTKDKEKCKSSSKDFEKFDDFSERIEQNMKKYQTSSPAILANSFYDSAEFHVVTKKKKQKKKQCLIDTSISFPNNSSVQQPLSEIESQHGDRSINYSNSDDVFFYSIKNNGKFRRKTASSAPPSEKSDSSDLDSVHSLPIGTTRGKNMRHKIVNRQNSHKPQSYADIARNNKSISINHKTTPFISMNSEYHKNNDTKKSDVPCVQIAAPEFQTIGTVNTGFSLLNSDFNSNLIKGCTMSLNNISTICQQPCANNFASIDNSQKFLEIFTNNQSNSFSTLNVTISNAKKKQTGILSKSKTTIKASNIPINSSKIKSYVCSSKQYIKSSPNQNCCKKSSVIVKDVDFPEHEISFVKSTHISKQKSSQNTLSYSSTSNELKQNMSKVLKYTENSNSLNLSTINAHNISSRECNNSIKSSPKNISIIDRIDNLKNIKREISSLDKSINRPPVIILNDENKTINKSAISNEFTFGDFNKDELNFYNDENAQPPLPSKIISSIVAVSNYVIPKTSKTELISLSRSCTQSSYQQEIVCRENQLTGLVLKPKTIFKDLKTEAFSSGTIINLHNNKAITNLNQSLIDNIPLENQIHTNGLLSMPKLKASNTIVSSFFTTTDVASDCAEFLIDEIKVIEQNSCSNKSPQIKKLTGATRDERVSYNDVNNVVDCLNTAASGRNKTLNKNYINLTSPATPISIQNKVIIDFIGSAWEEVANSTVTQVYNGQ